MNDPIQLIVERSDLIVLFQAEYAVNGPLFGTVPDYDVPANTLLLFLIKNPELLDIAQKLKGIA